MKNFYYVNFFLMIFCFITHNVTAQSIRKDYREMTQAERNELVKAFKALRAPDLIQDMANYHADDFDVIHFQGPATDVFLAWHRMAILEVEQTMQKLNPLISIPYWNWTNDNSVNSSLWSEGFMGQFNALWNLNRNIGASGSLPTQAVIDQVQSVMDWNTYTDELEHNAAHVGAHVWVGGVMNSGGSPLDPVFYLHHGMVDKLWQDWHKVKGTSAYQKQTMPRYDGTYIFNGKTLAAVNPNSLVDSRKIGVFFAENKNVTMEGYSVTNKDQPIENFYYQYLIRAGNGFSIPSGKKCIIHSSDKISLLSGFSAKSGANFTARIGPFVPQNFPVPLLAEKNSDIIASYKENVYNTFGTRKIESESKTTSSEEFRTGFSEPCSLYPNPFSGMLTVEVTQDGARDVELTLSDGSGILRKRVVRRLESGRRRLEVDASELPAGVYLWRLRTGAKHYEGKIVKQ